MLVPSSAHSHLDIQNRVSHLAGTLIERFKREQPELEITNSEVKCIKLAGLCHDLGTFSNILSCHGPFSHIFDNEFMPQAKPELTWSHEQASEMMLEYLIDDNNIDLEKDEIELIKGLIDGKPGRHSQRGFLFDIVANKRNSVDVDKFDYIERDCYNLGIKSSYDTSRLMAMCRVVNNQICFHHKEVYSLYDMFHTRYSLFKRIYTHRVCMYISIISQTNYFYWGRLLRKPEIYLAIPLSFAQHVSETLDDISLVS
ncbi:LOW QUALITY PROTEIN: hypothetical protein BC937DRAFT_90455 [Endogone sp. FLAS-F59071]|nr:LOW QUALITY PROTEIN: hypothetical protein BC937DRAFT_90455 [Endogone sp. FLAS-F59071]|eukprot:RUS17078.1 LOW QUALITY PROTEIN: hypothetical protein BC937DRAFT_90455 [Endogone sp. FLAS-F59071]